MLVRDILSKAAKLINKPQRWTRGELAKDGRGSNIDPSSKHAARFCVVGAMIKVGGEVIARKLQSGILHQAVVKLYPEQCSPSRPCNSIVNVNNLVGRLAAIDCLKLAIKLARDL